MNHLIVTQQNPTVLEICILSGIAIVVIGITVYIIKKMVT
jgi:hypothetical protein